MTMTPGLRLMVIGLIAIILTCPFSDSITCFSCHLIPGRNDCTEAGSLLDARHTFEDILKNNGTAEEASQSVDHYIVNCPTRSHCVIESIISSGEYKLFYRDCSDGKKFATDVNGSRLVNLAADNNTHCMYASNISAMFCVTLCNQDQCNGPSSVGSVPLLLELVGLHVLSFVVALLLRQL